MKLRSGNSYSRPDDRYNSISQSGPNNDPQNAGLPDLGAYDQEFQ